MAYNWLGKGVIFLKNTFDVKQCVNLAREFVFIIRNNAGTSIVLVIKGRTKRQREIVQLCFS